MPNTQAPWYREIHNRIERFQTGLSAEGLDGAILAQKVDVYYLAGTDQDAYLWVPVEGPSLLMVRKSLQRAKQDSPLTHVVRLRALSQLPDLIREHGDRTPTRIGLEMDILPAKFYLAFQKRFPHGTFPDISRIIREVRMVKSDYELGCIRKAVAMADEGYALIPQFLKDVRTEFDLASRIEAHYRNHGHTGFIRTRTFNMESLHGPIVSGTSAALPSNAPGPIPGQGLGPFLSQGAGRVKIAPNVPILVDYPANAEGYIADQSRIFVLGNLSDKYRRAHYAMCEIQDALAEKGRPGVKVSDLYQLAFHMAEKAGLTEGFMGYPERVRFVGHGIGLEIDEWPVISANNGIPLEAGMVIAMEPKFVFPDGGAVGVENNFLVTERGMEKMNRFPDEACVI